MPPPESTTPKAGRGGAVRRRHRARTRLGQGRVLGQLDDLKRAGAMRQAAQEPALLKGRDQAMDAGLGLEVQRLLHFVERGRDAGFPQTLVNEHEQFILLAGEHRWASISRNRVGTKQGLF